VVIDALLVVAGALLLLAIWWHGREQRSRAPDALRVPAPGLREGRPGYRCVLPPAQLLQIAGGDQLVEHLMRESRLPPSLFHRHMVVALQRFAALVQLLPASEEPSSEAGGLLRHALERVLCALTLRAGHVLPRQAGAERVDAERDAWTCAVFLGALLHGLGEPLTALRVDACRADGAAPIRWQPCDGPMTAQGAVQYAISAVPAGERDMRALRRMGSLLFEHVAPPSAVAFLDRFPDVRSALTDLLEGNTSDGDLGALIIAAERLARGLPPPTVVAMDEPAVIEMPVATPAVSDAQAPPPPVTESVRAAPKARPQAIPSPRIVKVPKPARSDIPSLGPTPVASAFLSWLKDGLASGELPFNCAAALVHFVEEGMVLVSPAVFRAYALRYEDPAEVDSRTGKASLDRMALSIQREVLRSGVHAPNPGDGSNFWTFELVGQRGGVAAVLSTVLLPDVSRWSSIRPVLNPALRRNSGVESLQ